MVNRVLLKKAWTSEQNKVYPVNTVLQVDNKLFNELIKNKYGETYNGHYPPKGKFKMKLEQLNSK